MPTTVPTAAIVAAAAVAAPVAAKPPQPRAKRVTFDLTAKPRVRNKYGPDIYSQIIYMRLDGLGIAAIRQATGLCEDTIGETIAMWQQAVALREGPDWQPRARNRRKTRQSDAPNRNFQHPTPKI